MQSAAVAQLVRQAVAPQAYGAQGVDSPGRQLPAEQSATLVCSPEAQLALSPHWTWPAGYTQSPVTAAHAFAPQGKAVLQAVAQQ
jgi:hypothetical protein